jgi:hypothetical protein
MNRRDRSESAIPGYSGPREARRRRVDRREADPTFLRVTADSGGFVFVYFEDCV